MLMAAYCMEPDLFLYNRKADFFSAKDYKTRDNVIETIVDSDMGLCPESKTDIKMSEGWGGG